VRYTLPPLKPRDKLQRSGRIGSPPPDPLDAVYTFAGAQHELLITTGQIAFDGLVCQLFVNEWIPARNDVLTDYTLCTLPSYYPETLVPAAWIDVSQPPEATLAYPTISFTFGAYSGPNVSIWGYVVTNGPATVLVWAQGFAEAQSVPSLGTTLPLALVWTDRGRR
jgi:hypothetical protein